MEVVGRERMLDEVVRRLDESRLVTITGPGGIGKTTVADEVARSVADRYPLGSRRVDLTLVDDAEEVAPVIAAQLGYGSFRSLLDSPTDEAVLVVVDNCEHVIDVASEAVVALLGACRSPTVLATSRSPLGVDGESLVVLGPLELPVDGDEEGSPAVQLFLQRARQAGATVPDEEVASVRRVCSILDGVPLAIELAAARSRVLTPTELVDHLGDLDTLNRPVSRGPARHRSLRDTIAWSYELLPGDDRVVFDRLAVLSGPFTVDDAHAVAGDGGLASTVDRLDRLVAASLLTTGTVAGTTYHRQLHLVRSYARERLVAAGEWEATWQRFVDCVTRRSIRTIEDSTPGWGRTSLAPLLGRIDQHLAVLRWCVDHDEAPTRSFVLVATLWGVVHQGRLDDIAPLAERALDRWDDPTLPGWADAAATTATCRYIGGTPEEAIELARLALEHVGDARYAPCTLRRVIAHARVATGDVDGAIAVLADAIDMATGRVPALGMEMTVSRAALMAAATSTGGAPQITDELVDTVRRVANEASGSRSIVNEIWARTVEASILVGSDPGAAGDRAERTLDEATAAVYPAAETVNLHTLASLRVDAGDLPGAARRLRALIDGLVARGADRELRNGLRLAAVVLERAGRSAWQVLAATAETLPVVSLFEVPGHERHPLPGTGAAPVGVGEAVNVARRELDALTVPSSAPPEDPTPAPAATPTAGGAPVNTWCRSGDLWTITFDGATVHLRASKGLADLARLVATPGAEVHCADLAGIAVEERSSGEVIDGRARREYEQRVRDLQAEIDEAEADADARRADRARSELDAIVDHLASALGLGGRPRRHTDGVERSRSAVTQRIRATIKRIRPLHPALAAHLDASVQTGTFCRYRPERPTTWTTAGSADLTS